MTSILFHPVGAINPATGAPVSNSTGQIFAEDDTAFANPLTVTNASGNPIDRVKIGPNALTEPFRVTDHDRVVWKSGSVVMPIWSPLGLLEDAQASRVAAQAAGAKFATNYGTLQPLSGNLATDLARAASNAATIQAAVADRPDVPTVIPPGEWPAALNFTSNVPVRISGPGVLVQVRGAKTSSNDAAAIPAPAITVKRSFGAPVAVTQGTVQVGPNLPAAGIFTQTATKLTVTGGNYARFSAGDLYQIHSNDAYPFAVAAVGAANVWKAAFVPVHGVGLDITGYTLSVASNVAVAAGGAAVTSLETRTLRGATSGVEALAMSDARDTTNGRVIFKSVTGDFTVGENVVDVATGAVVGTVGGMYLVMFGRLVDTYTTTPVLRKVPTDAPVDLDVTIRADGDTDAYIRDFNRTSAIILMGCVDVKVKARIKSGYQRGVELRSCYRFGIDANVEGLPNHAIEDTTAQGGYGYGVGTSGCTEYGEVSGKWSNLRHGFSTNVLGATYNRNADNNTVDATGVTATNYHSYGTTKYVRVHDFDVRGSFGAGIDTHEGCYFVTIENGQVISPFGGGRILTNGAGVNNRGFGTTVRDVTVYDAYIGFSDGGVGQDSGGMLFTNAYIGCRAVNFQRSGFEQLLNSTSSARLVLEGCTMRGDGTATNTPHFQYPYLFLSGTVITKRCTAERFNAAPLIHKAGGRHEHHDFHADYTDSTGTSGIRVEATLGSLTFFGLRLTVNSSLVAFAQPFSIFRNTGGDTAIRYDQVGVAFASGRTTEPPLLISDIGAPTTVKLKTPGETGSYTPGTPTVAVSTANTGAGTAPPTPAFVAGATDARGEIRFGTGTAPTAGHILTVTLGNARPDTNYTVLLGASNASGATRGFYSPSGTRTANSFEIWCGSALTASQAVGGYKVEYVVVGS